MRRCTLGVNDMSEKLRFDPFNNISADWWVISPLTVTCEAFNDREDDFSQRVLDCRDAGGQQILREELGSSALEAKRRRAYLFRYSSAIQ